MRPSRVYVRGLPLPGPLIESMASGAWPAQDDTRLRAIMPWFAGPLDILADVHQMRRESEALNRMTDDGVTAELFRQARGSHATDLVELPWLDAELAVPIGVNRKSGADVVLALDYRTGSNDPRVVASDRWTDPDQCAWRAVAPAFSAFAGALGVEARRRYQYVGPEEIRVQIWSQGSGRPVTSPADLADWLARQDGSERGEPMTFVIDESTTLRLAPRRSEHVVCAGGAPVLSAGEITFEPSGDGWRVSEISNQSAGYCPEPDSYAAVQVALDNAGLDHPGSFTVPIVFRRCVHCGQLNIVKDDHYACAMCDEPLPAAWNADAPGAPAPRPRNGTTIGDIVSGTVLADERPFGPRIRLDGDASSTPAYVRDFPWKGRRSEAVRDDQPVTAEVVSIDDAAGRVWLSLAATEHPELWQFLKSLHTGDVLDGTVADVQNFGVFISLDEGPAHPSFPGVGFVTVPELAWEYFEEVTDVVHVGQRVRGEVLAFDTTNGEARLSLRALRPDPFQIFADNTALEQCLTGTVTKIVPFGVFVEVAAGVHGLVHKDELADVPVDSPEQVVRLGEQVQVTVIGLERDRRRLHLSRTRGHDPSTLATERPT